MPKRAATSLIQTPGSNLRAARTTSSRNSRGSASCMVNNFPAVPTGTTHQMSPLCAAAPNAAGHQVVDHVEQDPTGG